MPHARVHEPDQSRGVVSRPTGLERARRSDIEHELGRLEDPTLGIGLELGREREHLHPVVRGVGQRQ
jgi:hypothetical protein